MINQRYFQDFLRFYIHPVLGTVQLYLGVFISVSLLSFATILRDFYSAPLLLLQFLSPIILPFIGYLVPAGMISASAIGFFGERWQQLPDRDAQYKAISTTMTRLNIATPLGLSFVYLMVYYRIRGDIELNTMGLTFGVLAILSGIWGYSLGRYSTYITLRTLSAPLAEKEKRTLTHDLEEYDDITVNQLDMTDDAQQFINR